MVNGEHIRLQNIHFYIIVNIILQIPLIQVIMSIMQF